MKWIVVAIILVIVPYTYLTLHYRKPGRAFEPYHDIKDRANTVRLLSAGFQRVPLVAERPADPRRGSAGAPIFPAAGGLPAALARPLLEKPLLPSEILSVSAAPQANRLLAYSFEFTCAVPDNHQQLGGAWLYLRDEEIFIVPDFEQLTGDLLARSRENVIRLTVPAGLVKPGRYRITLVGEQRSKAWTLEVR